MQRKHAQKALETSQYVFMSLVVMESLRMINSFGIYGIIHHMATDLGISLLQARSSIVSPFLMGLIFGQFMIGPLSDRYGRINVFIIMLNIYAMTSLLCRFGESPAYFWFFRLLSGFTAAIGEISVRAILSDYCTLQKGSRLFSKISGAAGMIVGIAPIALDIMAQHYGWRSYFTINAIACCTVSSISAYLISELGNKADKQALSFAKIKRNFSNTLGCISYCRFALLFCAESVIFELMMDLSPIMLIENYHASRLEYTFIVGFVVGMVIFISSNINSRLLNRYTPVSIALVAALLATLFSVLQLSLFSITDNVVGHELYIVFFIILSALSCILSINFFVLATQSAPGKVSGGFVSSLTISIGSVGLLIGVNVSNYFSLKNLINGYLDLSLIISVTTLFVIMSYQSMLRDQQVMFNQK